MIRSPLASESSEIAGRTDFEFGEFLEQGLLAGREFLKELRILQALLAVLIAEPLELAQFPDKQPAPRRRKLAPLRQDHLANLAALLGSEPLEDPFAADEGLLLLGREAVPLLEAGADLRLTFGRQGLEAAVVFEEALLLLRRHFLEPLEPSGGELAPLSPALGAHFSPRLRLGGAMAGHRALPVLGRQGRSEQGSKEDGEREMERAKLHAFQSIG